MKKSADEHPSTVFRAGDRVSVRSANEILATLDERGELDSMPFMPEMLEFCGQELTVEKVAHKACDTVSSQGLLKLEDAVHLTAVRCNGSAHGGCQNACLLYWKNEWLTQPGSEPATTKPTRARPANITPATLQELTRKEPDADGTERFSCQATELTRAAVAPIKLLDMGQYVDDFKSGNASIAWILRAFAIGLFNRIQARSVRVLPPRLRFRRGTRWPFLIGRATGRTPVSDLNLQPGDRVRIKSQRDILETLDSDLRNRGLAYDGELSRFCGKEAVVERRVQQVIDEKTCRMAYMKTPSVILEGVYCEGAYNSNCPRAWTGFWREIWLDRVDQKPAD